MSVRVNQRWPDGLKERVEERVGRSKVTEFTVEALEKALGSTDQHDGLRPGAGDPLTRGNTSPASSRAPSPEEIGSAMTMASDRAVEVGLRLRKERADVAGRHCERCKAPIPSPTLRRHDGCGGGKVVPEPV